ncbi:MAG: flagellar export chaperone FliS [Exilispira sp.]
MVDNKQAQSYLEMKVKTASPIQLVIMLYDKAIVCLNTAIELINKKSIKFDVINNNIIRAQDIISELMLSLDFEQGGEIAQNLFSIYDYCMKQMIDGNIKKDSKLLTDVVKILSELRSAWAELEKKDTSKKSIQNNGSEGSSFNFKV